MIREERLVETTAIVCFARIETSEGRYEGALDCKIVRDQDTVGIRRVVQQDEDASDVRPLLEALDLLLIPADLLTPLCHW